MGNRPGSSPGDRTNKNLQEFLAGFFTISHGVFRRSPPQGDLILSGEKRRTVKKTNIQEIPLSHKNEHEGYEHWRRRFVSKRKDGQCTVSVFEIPPRNSMCPYHYHLMNEEVFYIISGTGRLFTPQGEQTVTAGDLLFFPANENGAHKLTNLSETEPLSYIDFDTENPIDVAVYPDSGKIGIWGKEINRVYQTEDSVEYYRGE